MVFVLEALPKLALSYNGCRRWVRRELVYKRHKSRLNTSLGLEAALLTLPKSDKLPGTAPGISESELRTLRYRELGRACMEKHIAHLLVAHHEDDQAETVVMRVINGARGPGTQGMRSVAGFPEGDGVWRISNEAHTLCRENPRIAGVGMTLLRPLLKCSKLSLVKTCESAGIEWFDDSTNLDPTLTHRNAVRCLVSNYPVPKALQKARVLQLSKICREREARLGIDTKKILDSFQDLTIDLRSAKLSFTGDFDDLLNDQKSIMKTVRLLQRLAELVTPNANVDADQIGPVLNLKTSMNGTQVISGAHLLWQRSRIDNGPAKWIISRQPYTSIEKSCSLSCSAKRICAFWAMHYRKVHSSI